MSKKPKYHFLIVVQTSGGKSIFALPGQTFGFNPVPEGKVIKDERGGKAVARVRKASKSGEVLYTTTLRERGSDLVVKDIYPLSGDCSVLHPDVRDVYLTMKEESGWVPETES